MTPPLRPPPRKDPQRRTPLPHLPPAARSRAALGLTAAAARGEFTLQVCAECQAAQYPPRDACGRCLSLDLRWQAVPPEGELLAETRIHVSPDLYFQDRMPWRMGTVRLACGPSVLCHLHGECKKGAPVRLISRLDRAGQGVLMALPITQEPHMEDDSQLRELTASPKHRRVLITDARAATAPALARALVRAGAAQVWLGEAESWRPNLQRCELETIERTEIVPLDMSNESSVRECAADLAGKTDIMIQNAEFTRPGRLFERAGTTFALSEMEAAYFGPMRLAQAFGPAMRSRGGDGVNSAAAWVSLLPVEALCADPARPGLSAAAAAGLSLTQSLRAELAAGGVRVLSVFSGPADDEWHAEDPLPKVAPQTLARDVLTALENGTEEVCSGDIARDRYARWRRDAKVLERELAGGGA